MFRHGHCWFPFWFTWVEELRTETLGFGGFPHPSKLSEWCGPLPSSLSSWRLGVANPCKQEREWAAISTNSTPTNQCQLMNEVRVFLASQNFQGENSGACFGHTSIWLIFVQFNSGVINTASASPWMVRRVQTTLCSPLRVRKEFLPKYLHYKTPFVVI